MTSQNEASGNAEYILNIMADGRWRTAPDVANMAKRDGLDLTKHTAGHAMARLARSGSLDADCVHGFRMWKGRADSGESQA